MRIVVKCQWLFVLAFPLSVLPAAAQPSLREQAVTRILAENCSACHSAQIRSSEFSVANLQTVIAGGKKDGRAVVGRHPESSSLVARLKGEISPQMPPGKPLSADDIAAVEAWIRELPTENPQSGKQESRWAYEKPVKSSPPAVKNSAWVKNPIDAFVLAKLEEQKIAPAPRASKRTCLLYTSPSPRDS